MIGKGNPITLNGMAGNALTTQYGNGSSAVGWVSPPINLSSVKYAELSLKIVKGAATTLTLKLQASDPVSVRNNPGDFQDAYALNSSGAFALREHAFTIPASGEFKVRLDVDGINLGRICAKVDNAGSSPTLSMECTLDFEDGAGSLPMVAYPEFEPHVPNEAERTLGIEFLSGDFRSITWGDSLNNSDQGVSFWPYYWGMINRLPSEFPIIGFDVGHTTGGARPGGNSFFQISGGQASSFVGDAQTFPLPATASAAPFKLPGTRAEWTVKSTAQISNFGNIYDCRCLVPEGFTETAGKWTANKNIRIGVPFVSFPVGADDAAGCINRLEIWTTKDDNADGTWEAVANANADIGGATPTVKLVSTATVNSPSGKIQMQIRGANPNGSQDDNNKSIIMGHVILYDVDQAAKNKGFFSYSISIGGETADYQNTHITASALQMLVSAMPCTIKYCLIWIRQNQTTAESNDVFGVGLPNVEAMCLKAVEAGMIPLLIVTPQVEGATDAQKTLAANNRRVMLSLRSKYGWPCVDFVRLCGNLGPGVTANLADGIHPTKFGSKDVVAKAFFNEMARFAAGPAATTL